MPYGHNRQGAKRACRNSRRKKELYSDRRFILGRACNDVRAVQVRQQGHRAEELPRQRVERL